MKRILAMLLIITLTTTLSGCKSQEEQFETAVNNMSNLENVTIKMEISMSFFGQDIEMDTILKIDGYVTLMTLEDEQFFILDYEGESFDLIDMGNNTFGAIYEPMDEESDLFGLPPIQEFQYEDFTFEDDYFVYTGDLEELQSLKIKIEDGYITEMILDIEEEFEGITLGMSTVITIYDIGETIIDNQPYVPHFEEYAPILIELQENGYTVMYEGNQVVVLGPNNFSLIFEPDFPSSWGSIEINPIDNTVWTYDGETEDFFPFEEYYNGLSTPSVTPEILELLDQLLEIWAE